MRKAEREKRMNELGADLLYWNEQVYVAENNKDRLESAQRAYATLGQLVGYANGDYNHYMLCAIREQQLHMFGESWAITSLWGWLSPIDEDRLAEIGKKHKKDMEEYRRNLTK